MAFDLIRAASLVVFSFACAPVAVAAPFAAATGGPIAHHIDPVGYWYKTGHYEASALSGRPTLILRLTDSCTHHAAPNVGGFADHGAVAMKEGTAAACDNPHEPVTEVWYTSAKGFHGVDTVTLSPSSTTISVTVK